MERESFIFYRSFASIRSLKPKERDWMVWAIIDYALDGIEPKWESAPKCEILPIIFEIWKPIIDANNRKYDKAKKKVAYRDYLQTDYWKKVALIKKETIGRCEMCGSIDNLEVHHLTYKHFGKEMEHLDDLKVLCHKCHENLHHINND